MGKTRALFMLLADGTSSEQVQQALTCKVGDAEEHHLMTASILKQACIVWYRT